MTLEPTIDNLRELDADFARDLAAIARPGVSGGLAGHALAGASRGGPSVPRLFKYTVALGTVGALLLLLVVGALLPTMGRARASARVFESAPMAASVSDRADGFGNSGPVIGGMVDKFVDADGGRLKGVNRGDEPGAAKAADRQVIRTANLAIRVASVRDSYQNASALVREDLGEFISQTTFSGVEPYTSATVTLRVNADRLASVMQSLRGLGDVTSESTGGEDVTDQLVDLDARLRNERRIEQELLTLLDTRKDAPLEDVLKVRESLGRIRENIERLAAQQAQLTNRVALATITAQLVAKSEPVAREQGWLAYTGAELGRAWRWSLRSLADTVAFILAVTVGGLIWWIILGVIALGVRRWWKRRQRRLAVEPPPAI